MSSPFALTRGIDQQRVAVPDAPDGLFVFELGHANRGDARLGITDYHEITQEFTRAPQSAFLEPVVQISPNDFTGAWDFSVRLNSVVVYERSLRPDVPPLTLTDIKIPLATATPGLNTLTFRLELVG